MPIVRWRPFGDWPEDFDRLFEEVPMPMVPEKVKGFVPAIDVYKDKNNIVAETPLAGVDPKDVKISIENDILTIEGKTEKKSEVEEKNYFRKEVRSGSFFRRVALPTHVFGDKATATFEDGVLKVVVPTAGEVEPKKIAIKVVSGKKVKKDVKSKK